MSWAERKTFTDLPLKCHKIEFFKKEKFITGEMNEWNFLFFKRNFALSSTFIFFFFAWTKKFSHSISHSIHSLRKKERKIHFIFHFFWKWKMFSFQMKKEKKCNENLRKKTEWMNEWNHYWKENFSAKKKMLRKFLYIRNEFNNFIFYFVTTVKLNKIWLMMMMMIVVMGWFLFECYFIIQVRLRWLWFIIHYLG